MVKPFHPSISTSLLPVKNYEELDFQFENICSGYEGSMYSDRFVLSVPYALHRLQWHVIFNAQKPNDAPDILFSENDKTFFPLFFSENQKFNEYSSAIAKILKNWNVNDANLFLQFILLLRKSYSIHHIELAKKKNNQRLNFEISTLENIDGLEAYCLNEKEIQFLIPIHGLNFFLLKNTFMNENFSKVFDSKLYLKVKFSTSNNNNMSPIFQLNGENLLLQILNLNDDNNLPKWNLNSCVSEFISELKIIVEQQIQESIFSLDSRKIFVSLLPEYFGQPLEIESVMFQRVSCLCTAGNFFFIIHFSLPDRFPTQPFNFTIQSAFHFYAQGNPVTKSFFEFPYSPRWHPSEMIKRLCSFVANQAPDIQTFFREENGKR